MAKGATAWLKPIGTGTDPLPDWWLDDRGDVLTQVGFPDVPSGIGRGDLMVYYASGKQKLFAIARSTGPGSDATVERKAGEERWPYVLPVQVRLLIPDLRLAPDYSILGKNPHSVSQQSHVSLTDAEYGKVVQAFNERLTLPSVS